MRNKRITGFTNCKISNLLVTEGFTGSGQAINSEKIDLVESDSNGSINITVPSGKDLIEFTNLTYSNGSTEYELLKGVVTNVSTGTPSLEIYNGYSNLDMVDLALGTKVGNIIPIVVTGKNFTGEPTAINYPNGVGIDTEDNEAIEILAAIDPTKFSLRTYIYNQYSFIFTDLTDNSIIDIFNEEGVQTLRVRFTLSSIILDNGDSVEWFFDVGQYERTEIGQIDFGSVNKIIKDPNGLAIETSLDDFRSFLQNGRTVSDPEVLQNLTFGTLPSTFTNVLSYNVI